MFWGQLGRFFYILPDFSPFYKFISIHLLCNMYAKDSDCFSKTDLLEIFSTSDL